MDYRHMGLSAFNIISSSCIWDVCWPSSDQNIHSTHACVVRKERKIEICFCHMRNTNLTKYSLFRLI